MARNESPPALRRRGHRPDSPWWNSPGSPAAYRGRILAKLDHLNPGFSKKDRIARQIIEDAEAGGEIRPGQTVIELTSGNTGTVSGHRLRPQGLSLRSGHVQGGTRANGLA